MRVTLSKRVYSCDFSFAFDTFDFIRMQSLVFFVCECHRTIYISTIDGFSVTQMVQIIECFTVLCQFDSFKLRSLNDIYEY